MVRVKNMYSLAKSIIGKRPKLFLAAVVAVVILLVAVSVFGVVRKSKLVSANHNKLTSTTQSATLGPQPAANEPVVKPNAPDNKTQSTGDKNASCKSQPPLATSTEYRNEVERHGKRISELKKYWLAHGGLKQEGFTSVFKAEVELNKKNMAKLKSATQESPKPKC